MNDPNTLEEHQVYSVIGQDGFERVCAEFYRQVVADDILGPMYPADDMAGAEQRLRDFLIYRFGGPQTYIQERGHPRLRGRHMPFAIDAAARDRWVELMEKAIDAAELPQPAADVLRGFFAAMATFLVNR